MHKTKHVLLVSVWDPVDLEVLKGHQEVDIGHASGRIKNMSIWEHSTIQKTLTACFVLIMIASTVIILLPKQAHSHSWYPKECCSDRDCAPATDIKHIDAHHIQATNKFGTAIYPKRTWKHSKDCSYHSCLASNAFTKTKMPLCLLIPTCS